MGTDRRAVDSWLVWQLADSAFPTGSFAHSWGLEAAWQSGEIDDLDELAQFLDGSIVQQARGALPFLTSVHRDPSRLSELDLLSDVFITNPVANRASRVQGRAMAMTVARVWPTAALDAVERTAREGCGHAAPVAGAALAALDLPLETAQRLFLLAAARGVLAAAVRLGIAGSYDAQRLQFECAPTVARALERFGGLDAAEAAQAAPVLDLLQAAHDRLYSRLFQS